MTELSTLIARHGLAVAIEPADENPDLPNGIPGMSHWSVTIEGDVLMPVSYSVSLIRDGVDQSPPTSDEALTFLRNDLMHPAYGAEDDEWLRAHQIDPGGELAEDWLRARDRIVEIGSDVLEALPDEVCVALMGPDRVQARLQVPSHG